MRVAVIGASGNAGTAVLEALGEEERVEQIVAVARRLPDRRREPYDAATWHRLDVGAPVVGPEGEEHVVDRLAHVLAGVDSVVHLAWAIQPNHKRDQLRRTNVTGTRRVVEACRAAGVGHLVAASSVGAYAPSPSAAPRPESWPVGGIRTSHYAVDKAAQEQVLDEAVAAGLRVARLRPALIFDAPAGAEVARLFFGPLFPLPILAPGRLPFVPMPPSLRRQAVHGHDVADAYRRAVLLGAEGAFNIATDEVLDVHDIARLVDGGRVVPVPPALMRRVWALGWSARAVAADPGWLDMALQVPVMDSSRARTELRWRPRHSAADALTEVLEALAAGEGAASAPLRSRRTWTQDQAPEGMITPDGLLQPDPERPQHRVPGTLQRDILSLYLSDHLTGATAGVERGNRMASEYGEGDLGPALERLAAQLREERGFLRSLLASLEMPIRRHRQAAAWVAERLGRLKLNDRLTGSPMTPLLEIELLRSAVAGKIGCWETLEQLAPELGLAPAVFRDLAERAATQLEVLEGLHTRVAGRAFWAD